MKIAALIKLRSEIADVLRTNHSAEPDFEDMAEAVILKLVDNGMVE